MLVKSHKLRGSRILLAVCDSDILGKKFEQGDLQLDLTTDFYKGNETPEDKLCLLARGAYIISLVGKESVGFALRNKLVDKERVMVISSIPHAQVLSD
jgi:hypothetical protein